MQRELELGSGEREAPEPLVVLGRDVEHGEHRERAEQGPTSSRGHVGNQFSKVIQDCEYLLAQGSKPYFQHLAFYLHTIKHTIFCIAFNEDPTTTL